MKDKGLGSHCRIGIGMDGMKNQGRHKYKISCIDRAGAKLYLISAVSVSYTHLFLVDIPSARYLVNKLMMEEDVYKRQDYTY